MMASADLSEHEVRGGQVPVTRTAWRVAMPGLLVKARGRARQELELRLAAIMMAH